MDVPQLLAGAPHPLGAAGPLALGAGAPQPLGVVGVEGGAGAEKLEASQPLPSPPRLMASTGSVAVCSPGPGSTALAASTGCGRAGRATLLAVIGLTFWVVAVSRLEGEGGRIGFIATFEPAAGPLTRSQPLHSGQRL